jgi:hypothetical protein
VNRARFICPSLFQGRTLNPRGGKSQWQVNRGSRFRSEEVFASTLRSHKGVVLKVQSAVDSDAQSLKDDLIYLLNVRMAGTEWSGTDIDEKESQLANTEIGQGITIYSFSRPPNRVEEEAADALKDALENSLSENGSISNRHVPTLPQGIRFPRFDSWAGFIYVAVGARPIQRILADFKSSCAKPDAVPNPTKK